MTLEALSVCGHPLNIVIIVDDNTPSAFSTLALALFSYPISLTLVRSHCSSLDRKRRFEALHFITPRDSVCFFLDIHDEFRIDVMLREMYDFSQSGKSVCVRFHSTANGSYGRVDAGQIGFNMQSIRQMYTDFDIYMELELYSPAACDNDVRYGCDERFIDHLMSKFFLTTDDQIICSELQQWGVSQIDRYSTEKLCARFAQRFGADMLNAMMTI